MNFKLENETICLSMMNYIIFFFLLSFIFTIKQIALELHDKFVTKNLLCFLQIAIIQNYQTQQIINKFTIL